MTGVSHAKVRVVFLLIAWFFRFPIGKMGKEKTVCLPLIDILIHLVFEINVY